MMSGLLWSSPELRSEEQQTHRASERPSRSGIVRLPVGPETHTFFCEDVLQAFELQALLVARPHAGKMSPVEVLPTVIAIIAAAVED